MGFVVLLNSLVLIVLFFKVLNLSSKEESEVDAGIMFDLKIQLEDLESDVLLFKKSISNLKIELDYIKQAQTEIYNHTFERISEVEHKTANALENSRQYCFQLKKEIDKLKEGKNV